MSTESSIQTKTNRQLEFNLGTFNLPTLLGILAIIGMIWSQSSARATLDAQTEIRLTTIEKDRATARAAYDNKMQDIMGVMATIPNLTYRVTVNEQNIQAANSRLDRQSDAINGVRDSISDLGTKIEVLGQKLDMAFPQRRTELERTPPELAPKN